MRPSRKRLTSPWVDAVDLELQGFPRKNWHEGLQCILHSCSEVQERFDGFMEKLISATGRHYFPVYRMADGEFMFCLGWRRPFSHHPGRLDIISDIRVGLREKRNRLRGFGTMWGEHYTFFESVRARRALPDLVRAIARDGVLGLYFMRRGDLWGEQYILPMLKWFNRHGIELSRNNYLPFYMVYAALSGPWQKGLFSGKRVLVATGTNTARQIGIESGLKKAGVRAVEFLSISSSKSMFFRLNLSQISESPDLVLVGAGIGAANIIVQLKDLSVPVIDAGMFLECLIDPKRCGERPFLAPEN